VPSLTAQAFFRPMSSQKLQAQRGQRPSSSLAQTVVQTRTSAEEEERRRHRYSNASVNTLRDRLPPSRDGDAPPLPTSRGTDFTRDGQPEGPAASVATNDSTAPLQLRRGQGAPKLDTNALRNNVGHSQLTPKSAKSFRETLGLGSRRASRNDQERRPSPGQHEKLHSNPSSPNDMTDDEKPPFPSKPLPVQQAKTGKNYEYFAGNMLFFLSGRCLNTKAKPLNVMTFVLTVLPAALFFAFSAPWLWLHVSPALPIIFAYIFYITISSFLHAAFSDPGILPRNLHPHPPNPAEERDPLTVGPPTTEWIMVKTFPSKHSKNGPGAEEAQTPGGLTAMEVPTKYCKSCSIWRPPRAHHCRVCDACIETQDHHCVWLNNCVGRRNYRYFFAYVGFASVMSFLLMAFSLTHIVFYAHQQHISFSNSLTGRGQERVAFAMFLYAVLALPYPGSLFVYHLFLIARGETTREYLNSHKFLPKDRHRPFSQNDSLRNWIAVLMRPRPPTYMQFKRRHEPGDLRFGYSQTKKERKAEVNGRYSIAGRGAGAGEKKEGMEMKALSSPPPPLSRQQQQSNGFPGALGRDARPPGSSGTGKSKLSGGMINHTPR
jgi:palmitoyltransferase ZDHHC9/14/18